MDNLATAQKILADIRYATIATTDSSGEPWNTPVFYATENYTIYWSSHPDSVHSKNIATNQKAYIVIYNSKATKDEDTGLYMQASVRMLEDGEEIRHAIELLGARRGKPFEHIEKFMGHGPQRIYKATPIQIWINDAQQDADGDFIKDFRVEVENF